MLFSSGTSAGQRCTKPERGAGSAPQHHGAPQPGTAQFAQLRPRTRWQSSALQAAGCCPDVAQQPAPTPKSFLHAASVTMPAAKGPSSYSLGWNSGFHARFSLGKVLGKGSYGTVLEAVANANGERFAVKVLQKARRAHYRECIMREVSNWGLVQGSRYVAHLEGLYEDEQHAYIVQELCLGGDLKSLVEAHGYLSEHETAHVMMGVIDMLKECHTHSICYGDVKPANFMLLQPWQPSRGTLEATPESCPACSSLAVRTVDFGCSQRLHKGNATRRQSGTPLYSAPEIVFGRHGVPVDMWSAGVMMYQLLTGKLPFWPDKSLQQVAELPAYELLAAVRTFEIHYPRVHWFGLSGEARELVERMLDRNPAARITAQAALQHPWFERALAHPSSSSSGSSSSGGEEEGAGWQVERPLNNVVGFPSSIDVNDGVGHAHLAATS